MVSWDEYWSQILSETEVWLSLFWGGFVLNRVLKSDSTCDRLSLNESSGTNGTNKELSDGSISDVGSWRDELGESLCGAMELGKWHDDLIKRKSSSSSDFFKDIYGW